MNTHFLPTTHTMKACNTHAVEDITLWSAALIVLCLLLLHLFVVLRPVKIDEGGFLNPVLEYVHSGRVVYPAHGPEHAQTMIVHPPVHYWLIGLLMKVGLDFYPAAVTLPLLAGLTALFAVLLSPWSAIVKFSFIVGMFIPNFVLIDLDPSRSELQMALAWLAGLVFLESARLEGWRVWKLVIGSFLVAYASGLHYFAAPAVLGAGVYMIWAWANLGGRRALPRITWIMAGAAVFLIPYVSLFVIPEYSGIRSLIASLNAAEDPLRGDSWLMAFQYHRASYPESYGYMTPSIFLEVLKPLLLAGIPTVFLSAPLLLASRQTRAFAVASLPFQLGLLFFSLHKSVPYYRGEFTLFYAAILIVVLSSTAWLCRRLLPSQSSSWIVGAMITAATLLIVADSPAWQIRKAAVFVDELALARGAGKKILGANAIVGGRSVCLWYTAGGKYYRNVVADLIYPTDVSTMNAKAFFGEFDGVAEESQGSWITYNKQKMSLPSWYLNSVLMLQGFYAGRNVRGWQYGYYLAGINKPGPVRGWFWRNGKLMRFTEDPSGEFDLLTMVSPHASAWPALGAEGEYVLALSLPPDGQDYLTFHVIRHLEETQLHAKLPSNAMVRDFIRGRVETADVEALLATVDYHHEMTQIFYTNDELLATQVLPDKTSPPIMMPLHSVYGGGSLKTVDPVTGDLRYRTSPVQSAAILYSSLVELKPGERYVLSFDLKIATGKLVVSVVSGDEHKLAGQLFRYHSQPFVHESMLLNDDAISKMQLMIWANNEKPVKTDLEIRNVQIRKVDWINRGA